MQTLISSGKKYYFGALKGTQIIVTRAGDQGHAAIAHTLQFRCYPVSRLWNKKHKEFLHSIQKVMLFILAILRVLLTTENE